MGRLGYYSENLEFTVSAAACEIADDYICIQSSQSALCTFLYMFCIRFLLPFHDSLRLFVYIDTIQLDWRERIDYLMITFHIGFVKRINVTVIKDSCDTNNGMASLQSSIRWIIGQWLNVI